MSKKSTAKAKVKVSGNPCIDAGEEDKCLSGELAINFQQLKHASCCY